MPFELPSWPILTALLILHGLMGVATAFLAWKKGLNFPSWLVKGVVGGTVAFVLVLREKSPHELASKPLDK